MPPPEESTCHPPSQSDVRSALARVLNARPLRNSPQLRRLLAFLVDEVLAGRGESLVQYRVAVEGLGLPEGFDPNDSSLVRSHAGRLRKALAAYYQGEGLDDRLVMTLPAAGYLVGFTRRGPASGGKPSPVSGSPLVVISRFQRIGLENHLHHLPVSFADELAMRLGRAGHLRVAQGEDAAQRADAGFLLTGSIEQRSGQLLVRAILLEMPGGVQIWSRRHVFPVDCWDPAEFEEEIIEAIAVEVGADFGRIDRHLLRQTATTLLESPSLADALLKVKAFEAGFSEAAYEAAVSSLRQVLRDAPGNATAHGYLALTLLIGHFEYFTRHDPFPQEASGHLAVARAHDRGNPYTCYARVLEPLALGNYASMADVAAACLEDAEFPPGVAVFVMLCQLYSRTATAETQPRLRRLMRQNPDYPRIVHTGFALDHLLAGDFESAEREMAAAAMPDYWFSPVMDIAIHHAAGRTGAARAARAVLLDRCPDYDRFGESMLTRSLHPDFVSVLMTAYGAAI